MQRAQLRRRTLTTPRDDLVRTRKADLAHLPVVQSTEIITVNERSALSVLIDIPDIEHLSDEKVAALVHLRDGRWSAQTKNLLARFETARLDLNSAWAATLQIWSCPCCRRAKPQIARLSPGGVLLCRLEYHHDHLGDLIKRNYRERNPRSKDRDINIQTARGERALLSLVERFEETLICIDCNLTEGRAKLALGDDVDPNFTFTPSEIAGFIDVAANRLHEIDMDKARQAWAAAKDGFADRIDFAQRMAQRIAAGRHRREIAPGQSLFGPIEERDLIHRLFSEASPKGYVFRLARHIEARSVSYDSAGQSPVVKRKPGGRAPNDAEFAAVEEQQRETKGWMLAGPDWRCPCCDRSKREICRKSNKGGWTATIHRFTTYEAEDREESLYWRRRESNSDIIIGATREALICHDCRNIVAELQRRKPGLTPQCLTCEDFRVLVGGGAPHTPHMIDYDLAATMAIANAPLLEAIEDFNNHRVKALQTFAEAREIMNLMSWTWRKACEIIGFEFAKANGLELEEGDALAEWMLSEGRRFRENFSG